jgi:hypothetical protein
MPRPNWKLKAEHLERENERLTRELAAADSALDYLRERIVELGAK